MWKYWWTTGEFWREVEFINGIEQTDASLSCEASSGDWNFDGEQRLHGCQICQPIRLDNEKGVERLGEWTWYHGNGTPERNARYLNGELNGAWSRFFDDGSMMMSGRFEQGKADGEWLGQYRGSASPFSGSYSQDHPDGKWSVFQNGARAVTGQYENGKRRGEWVWFYPSGKTQKPRAIFRWSQRRTWTRYYEGGKPREVGAFKKGKRQGKWLWYDATGATQRSADYVMGKEM